MIRVFFEQIRKFRPSNRVLVEVGQVEDLGPQNVQRVQASP